MRLDQCYDRFFRHFRQNKLATLIKSSFANTFVRNLPRFELTLPVSANLFGENSASLIHNIDPRPAVGSPVQAILQDHFEVPSSTACSAASTWVVCSGDGSLNVDLEPTNGFGIMQKGPIQRKLWTVSGFQCGESGLYVLVV
jgi:hypothetical protein